MAMVMEVKNMSFFSAEPTVDVAGKVLDEFGDVEGLKEVIEGILALEVSGVYDGLVHGMGDDSRLDSGDFDELSELIKLASENMSKFPLSIPFAPLITAKFVMVTYTFVYDLYNIKLGRDFTLNELNNIFYGSMATRILLMLDDFDSDLETPKPTTEFFKRLGKVKWQNKQVKRLYNHIHEINFMLIHNKWKGTERVSTTFLVTEEAFILLLSGCSAVICGRDKINIFDVVTANKTYLKLINTDISRLM
ncbi:hypothetical protein [Methanobacterium aggregans]|uniref:hypothetical protein n=2 Tax=Methanobacterium aggregans TaxID=1615586 RepID=UPI001AE593A3|nr:hypothetical protein [Methanobacterium aggregans]MBP2045804.1 hypothetical protein [Methanobacterium aggregans]